MSDPKDQQIARLKITVKACKRLIQRQKHLLWKAWGEIASHEPGQLEVDKLWLQRTVDMLCDRDRGLCADRNALNTMVNTLSARVKELEDEKAAT